MSTHEPWQVEAQDIGGEVDAQPEWTRDYIPLCTRAQCPRWSALDGCDALYGESPICLPVVVQMARALRRRTP